MIPELIHKENQIIEKISDEMSKIDLLIDKICDNNEDYDDYDYLEGTPTTIVEALKLNEQKLLEIHNRCCVLHSILSKLVSQN